MKLASYMKRRLRTFHEKMRGKIFRYKKEGGTDDWRKFYNENLHKFYSSPDIKMIKSRIVKSAESYSTRGRDKNAYKVLAGKPEVLFKDLGIDGTLMSK